MNPRLSVIVGRIEQLALDAVVNAANRELLPGTGVDGALRAAAGPELTALTRTLAPIAEGEAILTPGFKAPARHIIHTAAPIYFLPGDELEKIAALARCYANAIALAETHRFATLAFPCLGTGNFGWPREMARDIAIGATTQALAAAPNLASVIFCCFTEADAALYGTALRQRL